MTNSFSETSRSTSGAVPRAQSDFFLLSCVVSAVVAATALSFPQYFIYVPFTRGLDTLSFLGFFALLGWILLLIVPPIALNPRIRDWRAGHLFFLVGSVLIYPLSTLAVKIVGLVSLGQFWIQYLANYPILLVIEWIFPLLYIGVGVVLSRQSSR